MSKRKPANSQSALEFTAQEAKDYEARVAQCFTQDGILSHATSDYVFRPTQQAFAVAVVASIVKKNTLIAEAGTGTGKTFAYLTPALLAGSKIIVSTAGKTLQDQLFRRDLPAVERALGVSARAALLKGRSNYICLQRLAQARQSGYFFTGEEIAHLRRIELFAKRTKTGDKAESGVPENSPVWPQVTSTTDNCLGSKCPFFNDCFVNKARIRAKGAQIVVVNHHLFLSAMAVEEGSDENAQMLPQADVVIFDEAHKLPDIAGEFFGTELSSYSLHSLAREIRDLASSKLRSVAKWDEMGDAALHAVDDYQLAVATAGLEENSSCNIKEFSSTQEIVAALGRLIETFATLSKAAAQAVAEREDLPELKQLVTAADNLLTQARRWKDILQAPHDAAQKEDAPCVLWASRTRYAVTLHETPISFAQDFARLREQHKDCAWVFTSATLATGTGDFSHFEREMGLSADTPAKIFPSPFAYHRQAVLYVPRSMPVPGQGNARESYNEQLVEETWPLIDMVEGRTFVLCTSYASMKNLAELLRERVRANARPYQIYMQGDEDSRSQLVRKFREHGHAILVGTMSFWEGIDIKGDALSLVIIDKLPFPNQTDPVLQARCEWLEKQGKSGFVSHMLPLTIITLKQGVGRLIRSESDRGIVVVGDPRIAGGKNYSRDIYRSLPDFLRTTDISRVNDFWLHPEKAKKEGW